MTNEYKNWILYTVIPFLMIIGGFIISIAITQALICIVFGYTFNTTEILHDFMLIF